MSIPSNEKRRRPGAPQRDHVASAPRTQQIIILVTEDELQEIDRAVEQEARTRSSWGRLMLLRAAAEAREAAAVSA